MGFDNPYRNVGRDMAIIATVLAVVLLAIGYGLGKLF